MTTINTSIYNSFNTDLYLTIIQNIRHFDGHHHAKSAKLQCKDGESTKFKLHKGGSLKHQVCVLQVDEIRGW
jgi:hypothetical protein